MSDFQGNHFCGALHHSWHDVVASSEAPLSPQTVFPSTSSLDPKYQPRRSSYLSARNYIQSLQQQNTFNNHGHAGYAYWVDKPRHEGRASVLGFFKFTPPIDRGPFRGVRADCSIQNTSDPERYTNPTSEGAGAVASDSLAAESAQSGGKFGENRDSNLKGNNHTMNNTDTSSAKTLAPASNAAEREETEALDQTSGNAKGSHGKKYPEGAEGQSDIPGHSLDGNPASGLRGVTGPSSSMGTSGQVGGSDNKPAATENASKGEGGADVDAAPGYVASVQSEANKTGMPKGKNITEGGFDDDPSNNASFTSDIGTENDPGRKAEGDMQKKAQSASGGTGPKQAPGQSDGSQYDVLDTDQSV